MSEPLRLEPDQLRELAALIAGELRSGSSTSDPAPPPLVDATTVATALGLSRATVYSRADELGAVRVGNGSRARLRFDVERAREALREALGDPSAPTPRPSKARRKRRELVLQSRPRSTA